MAKSAREFTIFYAWQSDTPKTQNRYLIEVALNEACERLGQESAIPYPISVTSDTKGIPGLCDIPAAILEKIASADAVVLDMTYIAKTRTKKPKYCPNPNVLFELGYAFHAVGFERLICVMNEAYGPATEILFDIGHRRHPVSYKSPENGKPRKQIISELTNALIGALEPTVRLGPRSVGIDADRAFELEANQIRRHWESVTVRESAPVVIFTLRPTRFLERRWPDADSLENLMRGIQVASLNGDGFYPPSVIGTDTMTWGLFNGAYGTPAWAQSYSGQFWVATNIGARNEYKRSQRDMAFDRVSYEDQPTIPPGQWIDFPYARNDVADAFRFASSFASSFHSSEQLIWSATAENLNGTIIAASNPRFFTTCSRKCASPIAHRDDTTTAGEFVSHWPDYCIDFLQEMFGMFDILGQRIGRQTLQKWLDQLLEGRHRT